MSHFKAAAISTAVTLAIIAITFRVPAVKKFVVGA